MEKRYFKKIEPSDEPADYVYGLRAVEETLRSGRTIDRLMMDIDGGTGFTEIIKLARQLDVPMVRVPFQKLDKITRKNHQGVICFISPVPYAQLEEVVAGSFEQGLDPLLVVLDGVTDMRNFGAIARSAECAGATALVVPVKGSARLGNDAMKTSAGALNYIPVARHGNLVNAIHQLKNSGVKVVAVTEKSTKNIYDLDLTGPIALLLGSEDEGIDEKLLRLADARAGIPMVGQVGSLNVSVAAAVAIFETVRQRGQQAE